MMPKILKLTCVEIRATLEGDTYALLEGDGAGVSASLELRWDDAAIAAAEMPGIGDEMTIGLGDAGAAETADA